MATFSPDLKPEVSEFRVLDVNICFKIPILISFLVFQVKFSELTLDMFRMLQALEREPEEVPPRTLVTTNEVSESPSDKVRPVQVYYKMKYIFLRAQTGKLRSNNFLPRGNVVIVVILLLFLAKMSC